MMQQRLLRFFFVILSACAAPVARLHGTQGPQFETVQLTITVKTSAGVGIPDAPMEAMSDVQSRFQMTDATGQATFTIVKVTDENTITVRLTHGGFTPLVPPELRATATQQYYAVRNAHAFKPCYLVTLKGTSPFAADIVTKPAVTVSGRILDGGGQPRSSALAPRSSNTFYSIADSELGVFSLGGVTRGEPGELWISGDLTQAHVVPLTAEQLQTDLNIGDLIIADTIRDATLELQMSNTSAIVVPSKIDIQRELCLVATDDAELHTLGARDDGEVFITDLANQPLTAIPIPAGTYYIVPGSFGRVSCFALLESIRAGRQALLDAAGVPKVTVTAGQTVSFEFDAQAALDAVMAVGGDLVCPCGCD
jgi:hypothetical protein